MSDDPHIPAADTAPSPRVRVAPRVVDREAFTPPDTASVQPGEFPPLRPYQQGPRPADADIVFADEERLGWLFLIGISMVPGKVWSVDWRTNPILVLLRRRSRGARWGGLVLATIPFAALYIVDVLVAWQAVRWSLFFGASAGGLLLLMWWLVATPLLTIATMMALAAAAVRWNMGTLPLDELRVTRLRTEHIVQALVLPQLATMNVVMLVFLLAHSITIAGIDYYWNGSFLTAGFMTVRVLAMLWILPLVTEFAAAITMRAHLFLRLPLIASIRACLDFCQLIVVTFGAFLAGLVLAAATVLLLGRLGGFFFVLFFYFLSPILLAIQIWILAWSRRLVQGETIVALEFCWNERDEWWACLTPPPDDRLGLVATPRVTSENSLTPNHEPPERGLFTPWSTTRRLDG